MQKSGFHSATPTARRITTAKRMAAPIPLQIRRVRTGMGLPPVADSLMIAARPATLEQRHPGAPNHPLNRRRKIVGASDDVPHDYANTDDQIAWNALVADFPRLLVQLLGDRDGEAGTA